MDAVKPDGMTLLFRLLAKKLKYAGIVLLDVSVVEVTPVIIYHRRDREKLDFDLVINPKEMK